MHNSDDVILIAGKGHENYQDELGVKTYFSDKEQAIASFVTESFQRGGRMIKLGKLHTWLEGSQLFGNPEAWLTRMHTDTRTIQPGDLFVALSGDQFDGNAFVEEAIAKGAVAVIAQHGLKANGCQGLEVADTKIALGQDCCKLACAV